MKGITYWLFGISGTGKSTIAQAWHQRWPSQGRPVVVLDEEYLKQGINSDLSASSIMKDEPTRRIAELAKLFNTNGSDVIVAAITPLQSQRTLALEIIGKLAFKEIYIDAPIQICQRRDPKGIYVKALSGRMNHFPGVNAPFELPSTNVLKISTDQCSVAQAVELIQSTFFENKKA